MDTRRIIDHWPIITAVLATSTAFGAGYQKIETLEQAIISQSDQREDINKIKQQQARIEERFDERTRLILDQVKAQRELIERLITQ